MFGFGAWPAAAKTIILCVTALSFLATGAAAYLGWKSEIRQKAQLEMMAKALAKGAANTLDKRAIEAEMADLDVERLIICNAARTPEARDCCHRDRKCLPLETPK